MEDKLIVKYIKKRNEVGLEELIDKYAGLMKAVIKKYLYNINGYEEECLDDIVLSIWNNIDSYKGEKNTFRNWVISISKYKAIDYKRKYLKHLNELRDINFENIEDKNRVEENMLKIELEKDIEGLLCILNDKDKAIFKKLYVDDKDINQVCNEMNLNRSYVYNRISRGRKKLRSIVDMKSFW